MPRHSRGTSARIFKKNSSLCQKKYLLCEAMPQNSFKCTFLTIKWSKHDTDDDKT